MTGSLQQKNGKYYAVLNFKDNDGKRHQKWISLDMEVKNNKRKAEQALKKLIAEYEAKKIDIINKQSFSDFMGEWLKIIKSSVKITTYNGYKLHYEHIKPYFDKLNVAVTDLTPMHIQNYYNSKISEGLSASTVKRHHANIHKALDYALKINIIPYNPADRITLPKREHYTGKFYDDIQLKRLMELCTNTPIESCVFLTINYGLRRSEVLGLKWSAVNFTEKTITINHTAVSNVGGVIYADTTKTKASLRTLPLTDGVKEYLLRLKAHQEAMEQQLGDCYHKSEYICTYDDGREIRPDYVTHKFAKILAKSDDLPKIRFHDLRHSAASLLINSGFNLKEVQEWLGHSDISTTVNHLKGHKNQSSYITIKSATPKGSTLIFITANDLYDVYSDIAITYYDISRVTIFHALSTRNVKSGSIKNQSIYNFIQKLYFVCSLRYICSFYCSFPLIYPFYVQIQVKTRVGYWLSLPYLYNWHCIS